ncbi:MAG: PA2778 family cysteine peptidase, partial [Alphaproteobacteria bacterium]
ATVLVWSGMEPASVDLGPLLDLAGDAGNLRREIVETVRVNARLGIPVYGLAGILAELAAGRPVIVLQNFGAGWFPRWHYAVAVGYDLEREDLYLHTGTRGWRPTRFGPFEFSWVRGGSWALVVLTPDRLPAGASLADSLDAADGLERAGKFAAAAATYEAIAQRWPGGAAALMGLGRNRHALGDLAGAEAALRKAIEAAPEAAAPAWNDLAYVLAGLGRRAAALDAARAAIALGGENIEDYSETLEWLSRR